MQEGPSTITDAAGVWEAWMERMRLIPERAREFSVDRRRAEIEFGIGETLARELVELGMPHAGAGEGVRFAPVDLHYVGLRLGCATRHLEAMRNWACALTAALACERSEVEVRCMAYLAPGTGVSVLGPSGRCASVVAVDRTVMSFEQSVPGAWPALRESLRDILETIAALDFCLLPEGLGVDFSRATSLSDCATAAEILVAECERRGVEARTAYGLLLACPYSAPHSWAEIRQDERWIPADPLLLALLAGYAGLERDVCPPWRSPGGVLLRLADAPAPMVIADGAQAHATFLTRIRPCDGATPVGEEALT